MRIKRCPQCNSPIKDVQVSSTSVTCFRCGYDLGPLLPAYSIQRLAALLPWPDRVTLLKHCGFERQEGRRTSRIVLGIALLFALVVIAMAFWMHAWEAVFMTLLLVSCAYRARKEEGKPVWKKRGEQPIRFPDWPPAEEAAGNDNALLESRRTQDE